MIKRYGKNSGIVSQGGQAVISFEISGLDAVETALSSSILYTDRIHRDNIIIAPNGSTNNLPGELKALIGENSVTPGILRKQVAMMYGKGPYLYSTDVDASNNVKRVWESRRNPAHTELWRSLDSWKQNGLKQSFEQFANRVITNYYYTEDYASQHIHNKSRITGGAMPIRGLEHIWTTRTRLATAKDIPADVPLEDYMLDMVAVGEWANQYHYILSVYDRYDYADPLKSNTCINYVKDESFGDNIYSIPTYYAGLKEFIKGSNLNPKYLNSFLKDSFSAKLHCIIPNAWFASMEQTIKDLIAENETRKIDGAPLHTSFQGVALVDANGNPLEYNGGMVDECLDNRLTTLSQVMSGEGKNQGKIFYSRSYANERGTDSEWQFKDIPTKYKEFFDAIKLYDDMVQKRILTGLGVDPSISNVGSEGVFNNSGAQVYYNYLVYLDQLDQPEQIVCREINEYLRINFPRIYNDNLRIGFYRNIPQRLEETTPSQRPSNLTK